MSGIRIEIVTPAPRGTRNGNRVTAVRWAQLLRELGHHVSVVRALRSPSADVLVALHARHSGESVRRYRSLRPDAPIIVALTGTDIYSDLPNDAVARRSLAIADALVVLQPLALDLVPDEHRRKGRVIFQSCRPPARRQRRRVKVFEVCVLGNLRAEKDPLLCVRASRLLPPESRIEVTHIGAALDDALRNAMLTEVEANPRYHWVGPLSHARALGMLARARVLVHTSVLEGGANAIMEALACGVPVLSSHIPGSVGILGADYPGYFEPGDPAGLADLLTRVESDSAFHATLAERVRILAPLADPDRERAAWSALIDEVVLANKKGDVTWKPHRKIG